MSVTRWLDRQEVQSWEQDGGTVLRPCICAICGVTFQDGTYHLHDGEKVGRPLVSEGFVFSPGAPHE